MIINSIGTINPSLVYYPLLWKTRTEGMILDAKFEMGRFVVGRFTIIEERRAVEGETTP